MNTERFSVAMCVYGKNDIKWFVEAVNSVLNQTVMPDEIVLVVDGPVPEQMENTIQKFEQLDIFKTIRLPDNRGHGIARSVGLKGCSNELVALMDADDICAHDRFEKQLTAFQRHPEVSVVGGQISEFITSAAESVGIRTVPLTDQEIKEDLKKRCPFNQVTAMLKKADVERAGGYLDWYCNEDYYLWNRMYLAGMKFANVSDILVNVRVGEDMYQRRGGWKYWVSEWKMQNFMLKNRIIGLGDYVINVSKRFVVQVLLPNRLRSFVFQKFARTQAEDKL